MTGAARVSVVVVSYHSATTIGACVRAVLSDEAVLELIVVDNASADSTVAIVRELAGTHPRIRLIANTRNRGFGAACNQGAALASGTCVLFLNPDAFPPANAISELACHLAADCRLGLLGCRVVDAEGRPSGPQLRREPTWRRSLMSLTGLARFERWSSIFQGVEAPPPAQAEHRLVEADAVNGAVMMVRRDAFQRIGGFDEGFVLHAEDLDLCRRVRDAGFEVAVATGTLVHHIGGVSSRSRPVWVEWQKTRSLWRYFRKHERAHAALRPLVLTGLAFQFVLRLLRHMGRALRGRSRNMIERRVSPHREHGP